MKRLQDLTLLSKFLFDQTMDIPEAHEAIIGAGQYSFQYAE